MEPRELRDAHLASLDNEPILSLSARRELLEALGPLSCSGKLVAVTDALRARVELESLCVKMVLPIWEALWPENKGPSDVLRWTAMYLDGDVQAAQLKIQGGNVHAVGEDREHRAMWPARVGIAASAVTRAARKGHVVPDYGDDEREVEVEDWDAGVLCSAIIADADPWVGLPKQRDYWHWYLTEAYERALAIAGL